MIHTFFELKSALDEARNENDLPDYLAEMVEQIIRDRAEYADRLKEVEQLAELLREYDTYAQTGYIGMGVDCNIMERALRELLGS